MNPTPLIGNQAAPVRLCAIDVGSNATKLRIIEVRGSQSDVLKNARWPVRIGSGVFSNGRIAASELSAIGAAFVEIRSVIERFEPVKVRVVATSAAREARNPEALIEAIRNASDLKLEIVAGSEEARLVARAVAKELPRGKLSAIVDVGGGSTELILLRADHSIRSLHSLPLGAVRLKQTMDVGGELAQLLDYVGREIGSASIPATSIPDVLGIGGTIGALVSLRNQVFGAGGQAITTQEIEALLQVLGSNSPKDLEAKNAVVSERASILFPGAVIVSALMSRLHMERLRFTKRGLRDGILAEMQDATTGGNRDAVSRHST